MAVLVDNTTIHSFKMHQIVHLKIFLCKVFLSKSDLKNLVRRVILLSVFANLFNVLLTRDILTLTLISAFKVLSGVVLVKIYEKYPVCETSN